MYYTQNDLINMKLLADKAQLDSDMINDLIKADASSQKKKNMVDGENYFFGHHDYLTHKNYYYVDGSPIEYTQSANNKILSQFHTLLVLQKRDHIKDVSYSVKEPEIVDSEKPTPEENKQLSQSKELKELLTKLLGKRFNKQINRTIDGASNKGVEWLHPYINGKGEFTYTIVDGKQGIPIYDTQYQDRLIMFIRYYTYEAINPQKNETQTRYKVEFWTDKDVTYWEQQFDGTYMRDLFYNMNPAPHWTTSNTARPDEVKKHNWGRVPFIPVFNNPHGTTDLEKIKNRIDAIDKIESGWCNDLEDFQEMVYIVKNMQGMTDEERGGLTEIGKAMQQMKTQKMILVGSDGGVETLKADIPVDAKERFIALMRRGIFTIGQGVDPELVGDGNITNVVIQSRYAGLNMKCDSFLQELESALNEFMWFVVEWINRQYNKKFNYEDVLFTFKKAEIINQSEMITDLNAVYNTGNLDRRTYLENVYFIKDPEAVIKRLEQEKRENIESGIVDLDSIPDEQIPGSVENKLESLNLNGAQVTAAGNIVAQAMSKAVSRDSALNQLQVFFGLTKEQAESILGQAEE